MLSGVGGVERVGKYSVTVSHPDHQANSLVEKISRLLFTQTEFVSVFVCAQVSHIQLLQSMNFRSDIESCPMRKRQTGPLDG